MWRIPTLLNNISSGLTCLETVPKEHLFLFNGWEWAWGGICRETNKLSVACTSLLISTFLCSWDRLELWREEWEGWGKTKALVAQSPLCRIIQSLCWPSTRAQWLLSCTLICAFLNYFPFWSTWDGSFKCKLWLKACYCQPLREQITKVPLFGGEKRKDDSFKKYMKLHSGAGEEQWNLLSWNVLWGDWGSEPRRGRKKLMTD